MSIGNVLIFGGTGMLAKATGWVITHANETIVYGRNQARLNQIKNKYNGSGLEVRELDYQDTKALKREIKSAYKQSGSIDLVIAWIHSTAPKAIPTIKQQISQLQSHQWSLLHIKGSNRNLSSIVTSDLDHSMNCHVREVRLGFIYDGISSRWLTHEEISNGVIQAIQEEKEITTVGTLEPWEKRP